MCLESDLQLQTHKKRYTITYSHLNIHCIDESLLLPITYLDLMWANNIGKAGQRYSLDWNIKLEI